MRQVVCRLVFRYPRRGKRPVRHVHCFCIPYCCIQCRGVPLPLFNFTPFGIVTLVNRRHPTSLLLDRLSRLSGTSSYISRILLVRRSFVIHHISFINL